jgi:hypothetical protein
MCASGSGSLTTAFAMSSSLVRDASCSKCLGQRQLRNELARVTALRHHSVAVRRARPALGDARHQSPRTCSLTFSPRPRLRKKRPGSRVAAVAAACATSPGCTRMMGKVTMVPTGRPRSPARSLREPTRRTGSGPVDLPRDENDPRSPRTRSPFPPLAEPYRTRSGAECSSLDNLYPIYVIIPARSEDGRRHAPAPRVPSVARRYGGRQDAERRPPPADRSFCQRVRARPS